MAQDPLRVVKSESLSVVQSAPLDDARPAAPTETPWILDPERSVPAALAHGAIGAAKGVGNTVFGLGKMVRDYTPIGRLSDAIQPGAFERRPASLEPTNAAQQAGYLAEQLGEFFVPVARGARLAPRAVEAVKSGVLTQAQTGSPVASGTSAALSAVLPGRAAQAGQALQRGAQASMTRALGPTKEWAKVEAERIAPQMLERGVRGSRQAMLDQAKQQTATLRRQLDDAYRAATQQGGTVPSQQVQGSVLLAADAFKVPNAQGVPIAIPGTERIIQRLEDLGTFAASLGPDIPIDKAAHIKRTWDKIVSKAGLFGPKATAAATDNAEAWAIREASDSFRQLLNANPTIDDLNRELGFWTGLKKVLKETKKRTTGQAQTGLVAAGMGGSGAVVGGLSGESMGERAFYAAMGGLAGRQFVKLVQSPYWRTTISAPLKNELGRALASGSQGHATSVVYRMMQALPSEARRAFAQ